VKSLVVYDSTYGNTENIAKALVMGLESSMVKVDIVNSEMAKFYDLNAVDLLCVGSPVHVWRASKPVKEFLERLKSMKGLTGKKAFVFDTKFSEGKLAGSAGRKIEKELKDLGLIILKPSQSGIVKGWKGPLAESVEEKFKQIGVELAIYCKA
jgi:flavorubredoxin